MKRGIYRIDYYLPANQDEPIFTSVQSGKKLDIVLPSIAATKEGYILLFRVSQRAKKIRFFKFLRCHSNSQSFPWF